MMMKMMGRWMLVVTVLAGAGQVAAVDAPSNLVADYAILGLKEVTLRGRVNVLSGDVGCNAPDGSVTLIDRAKVAAHMKNERIEILVDLGSGKGSARMIGIDLGPGYIKENSVTS